MVLSQFGPSPREESAGLRKSTLKEFFQVPKDVYPVGRLDYDSEGLLILTNDTSLNHRLLHPLFAHEREYWVQVEGIINEQGIQKLNNGMVITIDGKPYVSRKCMVTKFDDEPSLSQRHPPIRVRKNIPTSWIRLVMTEGKNRQVRKMTAAAGFPTLRLVRYRIQRLNLDGLHPGGMNEMSRNEMYSLLF